MRGLYVWAGVGRWRAGPGLGIRVGAREAGGAQQGERFDGCTRPGLPKGPGPTHRVRVPIVARGQRRPRRHFLRVPGDWAAGWGGRGSRGPRSSPPPPPA